MQQQVKHVIKLIGYASGIAANNVDCALGPWYMHYHPELFHHMGLRVEWTKMIQAASLDRGMDVMSLIYEKANELGEAVKSSSQAKDMFCVMGGDHSSAIGTWSAVAHVHRKQGDLGLIWIDAHMDSHTPTTSETKNIHGMPLAHLLGEGDPKLIKLFDNEPALKPENVCLIGVRSYESGEEETLARLGVKIISMDEVNKCGIHKALREAHAHVTQSTCGFGISLDLDGIDPNDAPGVGCPESNGISGQQLVDALRDVISGQSLLGLEIVEYNPLRDLHHKTAKLAVELLHAIYG